MTRLGPIGLAVVVLTVASGCYRRVVRATGLANRGVKVEEGYSEAWPIEPVVKEIEQSSGREKQRNAPKTRSGQRIFSPGTDR